MLCPRGAGRFASQADATLKGHTWMSDGPWMIRRIGSSLTPTCHLAEESLMGHDENDRCDVDTHALLFKALMITEEVDEFARTIGLALGNPLL